MIQDKNYVELSLSFNYKNGEGRNDVYSSARIRTRMMLYDHLFALFIQGKSQ